MSKMDEDTQKDFYDEYGPAKDHYENIFKTHPKGSWFIKWNWAAFLFGGYWMAYRRMVWQGVVYGLCKLIIGIAIYMSVLPHLGGGVLGRIGLGLLAWLPNILMGLYGNAYYGKFKKGSTDYEDTSGWYLFWFVLIYELVALGYEAGIFGIRLFPS